MPTTADYLRQLQTDKQTLKTNLADKGVEVLDTDTFTELSTKVADITGGSVSKYAPRIIKFTGYTGSDLDYELENLDTSNVTDMRSMFSNSGGGDGVTSLNLSKLKTNNVTKMSSMFESQGKLAKLDLSSFDTSKVTDMASMFSNCGNLNEINLSSFNTSNVEKMGNMFYSCHISNIDLSNFDTSKVKFMGSMFSYCTNLTSIDISNFDISNVQDMCYMFQYCTALTELKMPATASKKINSAFGMFYNCANLKELDLSNFNWENCVNLNSLFYQCKSLEKLKIKFNNKQEATNVSSMFYSCSKLKEIDLSGLKTSSSASCSGIFLSCSSLEKLIIGSPFMLNLNASNVLSGTPIANGNGNIYVPYNLIDTYKTNTYWKTYANQFLAIPLENLKIYVTEKINTCKTRRIPFSILYNGISAEAVSPEERGYDISVQGNCHIDGDYVVINDDSNEGIFTITATSTYDPTISTTIERNYFYKEQGYTLELNNGQWRSTGEYENDNEVYESDAGSYNIGNGKSIATITNTAYSKLVIYIYSDAESSYDYTEAFQINTSPIRGKGKYKTASKQKQWIKCEYDVKNGDTISIMYSKDSGGNNGADRGRFYIDEDSSF